MRTSSIVGFCAAVLVLLPSAALAQPGPPKPAPEMSQMAFFQGTWSCEGKMHQTPVSPSAPIASHVVVESDLNGFWQVGHVTGTSATLPPLEGRFAVTYDATSKQFVMLWIDNMGGWSTSGSAGWTGDTLVYVGESHMASGAMKTRSSFTRSADGTLKRTAESEIGGKWVLVNEETCRKR